MTNQIKNKYIHANWKKLTKEWMKRSRQIHCLQGANPVYHRGNGPLGGTLAIFFLAFWDVMGNPTNRREKKKRSLKTEKKGKKHGANSPIVSSCRILRGGSIVEPFGTKLLGQTGGQTHALGRHVLGRRASTLFDLDLDLFFFSFWLVKNLYPEKPVTEKPVTEKPVSEKPVSEKPVSEKPEWCDSIGVDCLDRPGCHRFISIELGHLGNRGGYKLYQIIYTYN